MPPYGPDFRKHPPCLAVYGDGTTSRYSPEEWMNPRWYFHGLPTKYTLVQEPETGLELRSHPGGQEANGTVVAALPERIVRGDFVQQCLRGAEGNRQHQASWYPGCPSISRKDCVHGGARAGQVFGPVHEVDNALHMPTVAALSVLVPVPYSRSVELFEMSCTN